MITVNEDVQMEWGGGGLGKWGEVCSVNGGDGERLEIIDRGSCNDGSRELIPVFHNPHRKCRPSPSAGARTLEYLVGILHSSTVLKARVSRWSETESTRALGLKL